MPNFSIVTVAFNSASTIEDTILSVQAQRGASLEHIIVDGGSTDGTMAVVNRYRSVLGAVVSEPDRGIYDAMNKGVALAQGEFVGFLNSDDYFATPGALAALARALDESGADAVWGKIIHIDAAGRPVRIMSGRGFAPRLFANGIMPPHPSFYARTEAIRLIGGFSTAYRIGADFDLLVRLFQQPGFRGVYADELVAIMRLGGVSTDGLQATRAISREILTALRSNGIPSSVMKVRLRFALKALEVLRGRLLAASGRRFPVPESGAVS